MMREANRDRVCVAGGPKTGKTSYARHFADNTRVRHTDSIIGRFGEDRESWSRESEEVSRWMDEPGPWLIEGVTVARALRKWLARNPEGKPCDVVVWLDKAHVERTKGQDSMSKATLTVFREVLPELERRGVRVVMGDQSGEGVEGERKAGAA
jgi:KaiC/GvpD/RAD55 family RecA-like ATPase